MYFENGVENLRLSNEMSRNFQIIISTIVLAELAFLGTLGFDHEEKMLAAIATTLLVLALVVFLIGVSIQQAVVQNNAKDSLKSASAVDAYIKKHETGYSKEIPDELRSEQKNINRHIKFGTRLLFASYILIFAASVLLIIMLWKIIL